MTFLLVLLLAIAYAGVTDDILGRSPDAAATYCLDATEIAKTAPAGWMCVGLAAASAWFDDNTTAEKMILEGAADLALSLEPGPGMASEDICYEPAYEADYLAVVRLDHPLASRQTTRLRPEFLAS